MKTKRISYVKGLALGTIFLIACLMFLSKRVSAQEDVTPPVLLEFSISPVIFDLGPSSVLLRFCATAADDLSGFGFIGVYLNPLSGGTGFNTGGIGVAKWSNFCIKLCRKLLSSILSIWGISNYDRTRRCM